jgi:hypothetical protein
MDGQVLKSDENTTNITKSMLSFLSQMQLLTDYIHSIKKVLETL